MRRLTIRFYTDMDKYMGWKYLDKTTYREVHSWLDSGNFVKIEDKCFNWINRSALLIGVYRHYLK